jgi:branched-chain amino acid transport system substrate-binding protein
MRLKFVLVAGAAVIVAACGARVSDTQVRAAVGPTRSQSAAVANDNGVAGPGATATTVAATTASGPTGGGSQTAATPTAGAAGTDNGGATDVGVTGNQIRLGTIATFSGPVPGLFAGAAYGMQAWAAYQNSLGGINGRQIRVDVRDDKFDTGENRNQNDDAITKDFALVGSFSLYDDAAVPDIEKAGVPDIHVPLATAAQQSPNNFSVNPVQRGTPTGPWELFKQKFPNSIDKVGGLYGDVPAAKDNYLNIRHAMETLGYKFVYERGYQPTESDFTADVIRMKSAGVKFFVSNGDVKTMARVANAMKGQNLNVDVFAVGGALYDAQFAPLAGAAGEGRFNVGEQALYLGEDSPYIPEVKLFQTWLQKVKPGFQADLFTAYGWGSGRLFAKAAQDAGPKLTRVGLIGALKKVNSWDGYGFFPEVGPATKRPASCFLIEVVHNGKFERWNSPPPGFNCLGKFLPR